MVDLHRHDEFSFYDGSGKATELAKIAKEKGLTSLGLSNHGNTSGLVQHYDACKAEGIKPILGVESYFLPKYKEQKRGFHLCLFAKDVEGYRNINILQSEGDLIKYYNPIITFDMLEKYNKGIICTSACVAGYLSQAIIHNKYDNAKKFIERMVDIFGDDFYIEIQPYKVSEPGLQENVNIALVDLAKKFDVKCILTSDSHRGRKEDLDSYLAMHMLKNNSEEHINHIRKTYSQRYMPNRSEMQKRFVRMHEDDFGRMQAIKLAHIMQDNLEEIESKVDGEIIDTIASVYSLPKFDKSIDSFTLLKRNVRKGLKERGIYKDNYIARANEELEVIHGNNFDDYFLIVQEYTKWAKDNGIEVGPGRGSGCNCLVNFALGITDVDPIYFDLDWKRFIREDKKQLPDIDIDFETRRRPEVIDHIINRYEGHAVQVASYGMYKVDNLINDIVKLYEIDKEEVKNIKRLVSQFKDEEKQIDTVSLMADDKAQIIDTQYDGLISTFCFLYNKVKYIGTHAAGVAISDRDIYYYTAVRHDKTTGKKFSSYNLVDLERCGMIKYDILGLTTLSTIQELKKSTGDSKDIIEIITDPKVLKAFSVGDTQGIFQYDADYVQQMLKDIHADSFNDVAAVSAMNRPGPLSLKMPERYMNAKLNYTDDTNKPIYYKYIKDTYGCVLYQEQINAIAVEYGGLNWNQADKLRKMDDPSSLKSRLLLEQYHDEFLGIFVKGMKRYNVKRQEATDLFESFLNYSFNKGHTVGYAIVSFIEMYYKVHYPMNFWAIKLNQANEDQAFKYEHAAIESGQLILTPHVNGTAKYSIMKFMGEDCIIKGLCSIKNVGEKAAAAIENERKRHGKFKDRDDFDDRFEKRVVNARTRQALVDAGALTFIPKEYKDRVERYNIGIMSR